MPDIEPSPAAAPPPATTSLGNRLVNVFIAPSEDFDEVKNSPPQALNWVVPLALSLIAGIIYCLVVFSQAAIVQQIRQLPEQRIEQMVKDGKMPRQMADKQIEFIDKMMSPSVLKLFGILGTTFTQALMLFFSALVLWLIGSFIFRNPFDYMKGVE